MVKWQNFYVLSGLASLSAILQLVHIGYESSYMWIDLVAFPWVVAFFLFGLPSAVLISFISTIIIGIFSPEIWMGASMKWMLSMSSVFCLYLWLRLKRGDLSAYKDFSFLITPLLCALLLRCLLALPLNYLYAIPIWFHMSWQKALLAVPWYVTSFLNLAQGLVDILLAWIVVFFFKLNAVVSDK